MLPLTQFEDEILDTCLKLLDVNPKFLKNSGRDCSRRSSPVYVGRVVSAMVSEQRGPPSRSRTEHSGGFQGMGESQLRELVFSKTKFTHRRRMSCDPSKQFIHSANIYQAPLSQALEKQLGLRHVWSLTSESVCSSGRVGGDRH